MYQVCFTEVTLETRIAIKLHLAAKCSQSRLGLQPQAEPAGPAAASGTVWACSRERNRLGLQPRAEPAGPAAASGTGWACSRERNRLGLQPRAEPAGPAAASGTGWACSRIVSADSLDLHVWAASTVKPVMSRLPCADHVSRHHVSRHNGRTSQTCCCGCITFTSV